MEELKLKMEAKLEVYESLINGLNKMIKISDSSDMVNSAIETANRYSPESIMHKFYDLLIL